MIKENIKKSLDAEKENLLKNASRAIKICRRYFKVLGLWKDIDAGLFFWRIILRYVSISLCFYLMSIRGIPVFLYTIYEEKRPIERLRIMLRVIFVCLTLLKYCSLLSHGEDIKKSIKHIEFDWVNTKDDASKNIMMKQAGFGLGLTKCYAILSYASAAVLTLLPMVMKKIRVHKARSMNITVTTTSRRFALPSYFGHSVFSESPFFEIINTSQVISIFVLHSISIAFYSLATLFVTHACGQLKIVMEQLDELVEGDGKMLISDSVNGRLSEIIKLHVRTLKQTTNKFFECKKCLTSYLCRFISLTEKMLRGICFVEFTTYTVFLCIVAYFCLLEFRNENKQPVAIFAWTLTFLNSTFKAFALCYLGELLSQEYENVGNRTYMIDWHRMPGKESLDLSLIIIMTRNPVTLTAGGQFQLSMKCFATFMQSTLGYVNMLRTVMD